MEIKHHNHNLRSANFSVEKEHYQNLSVSERLFSVFLGGVLLGRGIRRPFKAPFLYGAYLTYRGVTGRCMLYEQLGIDAHTTKAINIRGEFEIDSPPALVYAYWRNLENLPGSLKHLLDVDVVDGQTSHWKSNILGKFFSVNWATEIVKDEPGRLIGWSSTPDSLIHHVGRVTFAESEYGLGTKLKVVFSYQPPIGALGMSVARLINPYLEGLLKKELKTFQYKR
ncbi:SRPBCC family protein [Pedobacter sp. JCM 36344]|uniref:SRPBCC family protein n=1 Tax=Pedobacter sp. JCM 36344 TaxID=3374280 RepID=UPI00397B946D